MQRPVPFAAFLVLAACSSGSTGSSPSSDAATSMDHASRPPPRDAAPDHASKTDAQPSSDGGCHAAAPAPDRPRKIVISHPFDDHDNASADFEVFDLDEQGNITEPNVHFSLGTTSEGAIAMTPDGVVGVVAEDDGNLGVFRFDDEGAPHVVSASLKGSYYATGVVMDPSGSRVYVLDQQTAGNGGGIYAVDLACDGTATDRGLVASADQPSAILLLSGGHAVVPAVAFLGVPPLAEAGLPPLDAGVPDGAVEAGTVDDDASDEAGFDAAGLDPFDGAPPDGGGTAAVLVPWPNPTKVLGTADPFDDDNDIITSATVTPDGRYVLIGDTNFFTPNRVGVIAVSGSSMARAGVVENVDDPESLVASPFDDTVLGVSGFGNAFFVLDMTDGGHPPYVQRELPSKGTPPQLPGPAVMIRVGALAGRVLVGEDVAIRQVQFEKGAQVTDLGATASGNPNDDSSITGAIGVQP